MRVSWPATLILVHRVRDALELLLERRVWLVLGVDFVMLFSGLITGLIEGGRADQLYHRMVIVPSLLLAVPSLSAVIALEKRSGSIDLALSVASTERYFLNRVVAVLAFFLLQGWLVLAVSIDADLLLRGLIQSSVTCCLIGAVVLFWAVRLESSGAVMVASLTTLLIFGRWLFANPFPKSGIPVLLLGVSRQVWSFLWTQAVLGIAAAVFYLYARQRLRRPESLL